MPPPQVPAVLPEKVLLLTVSVPSVQMPPPLLLALLPEKVLLFTVSCAALVMRCRRRWSALLPEKVLLLTFNVPLSLSMPPPRASGAIVGEGAVAHGHRALVVVADAAAADVGAIAGEGAVAHYQRAIVEDAAAADFTALLPEKVLLFTVTVPP